MIGQMLTQPAKTVHPAEVDTSWWTPHNFLALRVEDREDNNHLLSFDVLSGRVELSRAIPSTSGHGMVFLGSVVGSVIDCLNAISPGIPALL